VPVFGDASFKWKVTPLSFFILFSRTGNEQITEIDAFAYNHEKLIRISQTY
jgi:hypothetical protein